MINSLTQCPVPSALGIPIIPMCSRGSEPYSLLRQQLQIYFGDQSDFVANFDETLRKHPELKQELESAHYYLPYAGALKMRDMGLGLHDVNTFYTAATKLQKIKTAEGETAAVISWLIDEAVFKQNGENWPTLIKPEIFGSLFISRNEIVSISRPATTVEDIELHLGMSVLYGDDDFLNRATLRESFSRNFVRAIADQSEVVRMLARIRNVSQRHDNETYVTNFSTTGRYLVLREKIADKPPVYHGFFETNRWGALDPDRIETQLLAGGKFEKVVKHGDVAYIRTETDLNRLNHSPFLGLTEGFNWLFSMFKPYLPDLHPARPSLPLPPLQVECAGQASCPTKASLR
jgi:hypothetical protein